MFASPAVHLGGIALGLLSLVLAYLLRSSTLLSSSSSSSSSSSQLLDSSRMLLWLILCTFQTALLLIQGILCFHSDAVGKHSALREEWNRLSESEKEGEEGFNNSFDSFQQWADRNLAILGGASFCLAVLNVTAICLVLTMRNHMLQEEMCEYTAVERNNTFQQRLQNRQRMVRDYQKGRH